MGLNSAGADLKKTDFATTVPLVLNHHELARMANPVSGEYTNNARTAVSSGEAGNGNSVQTNTSIHHEGGG